MIGYLSGKIIAEYEGLLLIENNGVGYEVLCSSEAYDKLSKEKQGSVYTYMSVKEDGVSLYGFISLEEKKMFLRLITVSGIGPKTGIGILSGMKLNALALAIATSDVKTLSKIKGLGKKSAERIILELREKITSEETATDETTTANTSTTEFDADMEDGIIALMGLGFTKAESVSAIKEAVSSGAKGIEQIIAFALKYIR